MPSDRRRFISTATMALAGAHLAVPGTAEAAQREPRELAALGRATAWLNSPRLTPAGLAGKVVLVNFWTLTCINWLRTAPYVRAWSQKYPQGFIVIGVHAPEFAFEKNPANVRLAVHERGIAYPVVLDNDFAIWRTFRNQAWPALFFIDARGRVRQHYFGEGEYERSELVIQQLLAEAGVATGRDRTVSVEAGGVEAAADWGNLKSSENYLGVERSVHFASPGGAEVDRRRTYGVPARLALNEWALAGEWTMGRSVTASSKAGGRIVYRFHARDLHLVMGPARPEMPVRFRVAIDGQPPGPAHGLDVDEAGDGAVREQRLYQLIRQPGPVVDRTCAIEFLDAGVEAFVFTFG